MLLIVVQKTMNLQSYKHKVKECLKKSIGETETDRLMILYEEDFPKFLKENWSPEGAASAILMGY